MFLVLLLKFRVSRWPHNLTEGFFLKDKLQHFLIWSQINWSTVCFKSQDMLAWVKKRRRTIRREDLISFLCGKAPPHRSSRSNPRLAMVAPSRANSPAETGSSVEADLQPFREAIALHGKDIEATFRLPAQIWFLAHPNGNWVALLQPAKS